MYVRVYFFILSLPTSAPKAALVRFRAKNYASLHLQLRVFPCIPTQVTVLIQPTLRAMLHVTTQRVRQLFRIRWDMWHFPNLFFTIWLLQPSGLPIALVLESPVRSSFLPLEGLDWDQDQSSQVEKLRKTGPVQCRPVQCSLLQFIDQVWTGFFNFF